MTHARNSANATRRKVIVVEIWSFNPNIMNSPIPWNIRNRPIIVPCEHLGDSMFVYTNPTNNRIDDSFKICQCYTKQNLSTHQEQLSLLGSCHRVSILASPMEWRDQSLQWVWRKIYGKADSDGLKGTTWDVSNNKKHDLLTSFWFTPFKIYSPTR